MLSTDGFATIKVIWMPSDIQGGYAGSDFYAKYQMKGHPNWNQTKNGVDKDFVIVSNLELNQSYKFVVVSVDGKFPNMSDVQDVSIFKIGMY